MNLQQFLEEQTQQGGTDGIQTFGRYEGTLRNRYHPFHPSVALKDFAAWCFAEGYLAAMNEAWQEAQDVHEAIDERRQEA